LAGLPGAFALFLMSDLAAAQSKITIAVGGGACLCYLPTVLAKQLGEFDRAGLAVELVDLKGGSDALKAVLGGSADVVFPAIRHCVNLAPEAGAAILRGLRPVSGAGAGGVSLAHQRNQIDQGSGRQEVGVQRAGFSRLISFSIYLLKKNGNLIRPALPSSASVSARPPVAADGAGPDRRGGHARSVGHRPARQPSRPAHSQRYTDAEGYA